MRHLCKRKDMNHNEHTGYDAVGLAALVRSREVSTPELLGTAIARTEAVNPTLNAVVLKLYELARSTIDRGLPNDAFTGVPYLLKDLFIDREGTTTSSGFVDRSAPICTESTITPRPVPIPMHPIKSGLLHAFKKAFQQLGKCRGLLHRAEVSGFQGAQLRPLNAVADGL